MVQDADLFDYPNLWILNRLLDFSIYLLAQERFLNYFGTMKAFSFY